MNTPVEPGQIRSVWVPWAGGRYVRHTVIGVIGVQQDYVQLKPHDRNGFCLMRLAQLQKRAVSVLADRL